VEQAEKAASVARLARKYVVRDNIISHVMTAFHRVNC
jgi:hypothetical protein